MAKKAGSRTTAASKKASSKRGKPAKKAAKKAAARSKPVSKKKPIKKIAKKAASKKVTKKPAAKKKPASAARVTKKAAAKKPASKAATKKPASKPTAKKPTTKKAAKATTKKVSSKQAPKTAPPAKANEKAGGSQKDGPNKKSGRKGITIVSNRPTRRGRANKPQPTFSPPKDRLLGPGAPKRAPLIPSGTTPSEAEAAASKKRRSRKPTFTKKQLDEFKQRLIAKRAELVGDISAYESEALLSDSGGASGTPQHLAEQGSDSYDRSLSLDLAAADRRLVQEIDDALQRIDDGTFGLCEMTGKPIRAERLRELPWARYSIEAARARERGGLLS